jgi:hypothetical protein
VAKNQYKKCTVCKIRLQGFFITEKKGNACFLTSSSLITTCHQWEVKKSKDPIKYIHVKSPILINNSNMLGLSGFRDGNPTGQHQTGTHRVSLFVTAADWKAQFFT